MNQTLPNRKVFLSLLVIQFLFGLNYLFSKMIMRYVPPLIWGSLRCAATALVLVLIASALKKLDYKKAFKHWKAFVGFSLLGIVLNQGCFLLGLHRTTATNSALLNTLIPVFTLLIVGFRGVEKFTKQKVLGFSISFIGVLILQNIENLNFRSDTFTGDLLTLANAFFYSLFLGYSQNFFAKSDFTWLTTWLFVFGTPGFFAFSGYEWAAFTWTALPPIIVAAGIANILLGTVTPYLLISFTLSRTNSSLVALFVYVQPIVASALAYFFLGQAISGRTLFSACLIFTGLFLVIYKKKSAKLVKIIPLDTAPPVPRSSKSA